MKKVLYTQRVDVIESYNERRDCADQNIPKFLETCGFLPLPVPNMWDVAEKMIEEINPAGIVFTGGNSLGKYGGNALERDLTEKKMLDMAIERNIPVYGFCRGMQVILDYFGCELTDVKGHVAVRHRLLGKLDGLEVNSFHNQALVKKGDFAGNGDVLEILAYTDDGVVEAVHHKKYKILATMWHPEREEIFRDDDIKRVQNLFAEERR